MRKFATVWTQQVQGEMERKYSTSMAKRNRAARKGSSLSPKGSRGGELDSALEGVGGRLGGSGSISISIRTVCVVEGGDKICSCMRVKKEGRRKE